MYLPMFKVSQKIATIFGAYFSELVPKRYKNETLITYTKLLTNCLASVLHTNFKYALFRMPTSFMKARFLRFRFICAQRTRSKVAPLCLNNIRGVSKGRS